MYNIEKTLSFHVNRLGITSLKKKKRINLIIYGKGNVKRLLIIKGDIAVS